MKHWDTLPTDTPAQSPDVPPQERARGVVPRWLRIGCGISLIAFALLLVGLHRLAGPFTYRSEPVQGHIIDAETKEGVSGVVVVALWNLQSILGHPHYWGVLHHHETVTDAAGEFSVSAMPRKLRPFGGFLAYEDPLILAYKPGYFPLKVDNQAGYVPIIIARGSRAGTERLPDGRILQYGRVYSSNSVRFSYWDGKRLMLARVTSTKEAADSYDFTRRYIDRAGLSPAKVPILWNALIDGFQELDSHTQNITDFGDPGNEVRSR
jgi:hypothetical protein